MGTRPEFLANIVLRTPSEHFLNPLAHIGVAAVSIQHCDDIGKARNQPAHELLLLVQPALHFKPFGDVDQRSLRPDDASRGIANGKSRSEAMDLSPIFPLED